MRMSVVALLGGSLVALCACSQDVDERIRREEAGDAPSGWAEALRDPAASDSAKRALAEGGGWAEGEIRKLLESGAVDLRLMACEVVAERGEASAEVIEKLLLCLDDVSASLRCSGLWAISRVACPGTVSKCVAEGLRDRSGDVRLTGAVVVGNDGVRCDGDMEALLGIVREGGEREQRIAGGAISEIAGPGDGEIATDLALLLRREEHRCVYVLLLDALIKIGPGAKVAVPEACELAIESGDSRVRLRAAQLLGVARCPSGPARGALRALLEDEDEAVRGAAATSLGAEVGWGDELIGLLVGALERESVLLGHGASCEMMEAIATYGNRAASAAGVLRRVGTCESCSVRHCAARALDAVRK
jgi:hypothetical protein